ncbi:transposase [Candidatus Enterovibrio escicola]|uniref:transposase n=1 Tax=Candidatus Enterovibrio escicola TaxID=1927127 RepID=UPI001237F707|nr:transposase [Candidatus Enterovibrio escacola]
MGIASGDSTSYSSIIIYVFYGLECLMGWLNEVKRPMGLFYSYKLHLITNDHGSIISVKVTTTNVDDKKSCLIIYGDPSMEIGSLHPDDNNDAYSLA